MLGVHKYLGIIDYKSMSEMNLVSHRNLEGKKSFVEHYANSIDKNSKVIDEVDWSQETMCMANEEMRKKALQEVLTLPHMSSSSIVHSG